MPSKLAIACSMVQVIMETRRKQVKVFDVL
jgi:hypothetical protein